MTRLFLMASLAGLWWNYGCGPGARRSATAGAGEAPWVTSTITSQEGILGRVVSGGLLRLLSNKRRIVTIDLPARRVGSTALRDLADDEQLTGFAALPDGSLWTLSGWTTLLRLGEDGGVVERHTLSERQTGLHSGFERLLYQPLDFTAGSPALLAGAPGDGIRSPWGALRVRGGDEQGAIRMALSFSSCGVASESRIPCWLANDAAVELVDRAGAGETIPIPELAEWVATDLVAFAASPRRVIRDVWLTRGDAMWLLVRPAAADPPDPRGVRALWRVDTHGRVLARHLLTTPARLILGVEGSRLFVLSADGSVVAVEV